MAVEASRDHLPGGPLLLLAPHCDDAALSCAAVLDRSEPVDIVTVFAGSPEPAVLGPWDALCGFADSDEALEVRRAEEESALGGLPHRRRFLPLLDAQYAKRRSGAEREAIADVVRTWAAENPGGVVAVPAGAGSAPPTRLGRLAGIVGRKRGPVRHPDHVMVRDAVLGGWTGRAGWKPLLYEDFPYLHGGRAVPGRPAIRLDVDIDPERKARRIAEYASQVPYVSLPGVRVDDPAALPHLERYWLLTG